MPQNTILSREEPNDKPHTNSQWSNWLQWSQFVFKPGRFDKILWPVRNFLLHFLPKRLQQTEDTFQRVLHGDAPLSLVALGLESVLARLLLAVWTFGLYKCILEFSIGKPSWNTLPYPFFIWIKFITSIICIFLITRQITLEHIDLAEASRRAGLLYQGRMIYSMILGTFGRIPLSFQIISSDAELAAFFLALWSVNSIMTRLVKTYKFEIRTREERINKVTLQHQQSLTGLTKEVRDTLHDMSATVQQVFLHYPVSHSYLITYASVTNAIDTSVENIRHLADLLGQLHDVEHVDSEVSWTPKMELFDVISHTENIADAVSATMDRKKIDFVVSAPCQERGAQHFNLFRGDKDVVAQILIKLLNFAGDVGPESGMIQLNLTITPPHMESKGIFAIVRYHILYTTSSSVEQEETITELLVKKLSGSICRTESGQERGVEVCFKMEVERRDLPRTISYASKQAPLNVNSEELLAFATMLHGVNAAFLTAKDSSFTKNIVEYIQEGFDMKLLYSATDDLNLVRKTLDDLDNLETQPIQGHLPQLPAKMRQIVFVDDDFQMLDTVVQHRHETRVLPNVVYFTSGNHELHPQELLTSTAPDHGYFTVKDTSTSRVLIVTKPVGPRKLLLAIRQVLSGDDVSQYDSEDEGVKRNGTLKKKVVPSTPLDVKPLEEKKKDGNASRVVKKPLALSQPVRPPINVLIAEDNPINQTILSTFLKKKGINVAVANDGQEAVEKWSKNKFHLVLMDILMPVMNGIEATRCIRNLEKLRREAQAQKGMFGFLSPDVVIVALTASSSADDRDKALAAGCNDFLTKPVSLVWLEKKIVEWGSMQALIDFASDVMDDSCLISPRRDVYEAQVLTQASTQDVVAPDILPSVLQTISANTDPLVAEEAEARVEEEATSYQLEYESKGDSSNSGNIGHTANLSQRELMQRLIIAGGLQGADRTK
jgi:CheY-like chemotaxis protein